MVQEDISTYAASTVLIVDDEEAGRLRLEILCKNEFGENLRTLTCDSIEIAREILARTPVHAILLDKNLGTEGAPNADGIAAIPELLSIQPLVQILMVTSSEDVQDVVQAIRLGAYGYVPKQSKQGSTDSLIAAQLGRALRVAKMEMQSIREEKSKPRSKETLAGNSLAFQKILNQAEAISESDRAALILGESGAGKTAIARFMHQKRIERLGLPQDAPFCAVNITAIPENLVESELFGSEKGGFTDAKEKMGRFEMANGGTLFLDEIGDLPYHLQSKLLTAIEDKAFVRVGGKAEIHVNFKLVCATNRDVKKMVKEGKFRRDLYARIATFELIMPPLSERAEDIPDIIRAILPRCCAENRVKPIEFEDLPKDLVAYIKTTKIEGNVRGIDDILSRLLIFSPKDTRGVPILKNWKSIVFPSLIGSVAATDNAITLEDLESRPFRVLGDDFPGLFEFADFIKNKTYLEAASVCKNSRELAKALKISEPSASKYKKLLPKDMSRKLKAIQAERRSRSNAD